MTRPAEVRRGGDESRAERAKAGLQRRLPASDLRREYVEENGHGKLRGRWLGLRVGKAAHNLNAPQMAGPVVPNALR